MSENHGLDTDTQVFFYEQDHYYLSNFSAFTLWYQDIRFDTSEQAYHWAKFQPYGDGSDYIRQAVRGELMLAISAHEAFKIAEKHARWKHPHWDTVKVDIMRDILRAKAQQHEYVRRKLMQTGDRELVENSWRDGFWGEGADKQGQNMLGKLWMEVREELRSGSPQ